MLIDLHSHTAPRSYDALQTPDELIIEAKGLGLDAFALLSTTPFGSITSCAGYRGVTVSYSCLGAR